MKNVIEGLLYIVGDTGISLDNISRITKLSNKEVIDIFDILDNEYKDRGINIKKIDNIYKFTTNKRYSIYYENLYEDDAFNWSNALLEVMAIIAYNQGITVREIDEIRGVSSREMVNKLKAVELISEVEKEDSRAKGYITTNKFLEYFNLSSIDELKKGGDYE